MTDIAKALEAAADGVIAAMAKNRLDAEAIAHAAVLAFLKAMPDIREIEVPSRAAGVLHIHYYPSRIVAAVEAEG